MVERIEGLCTQPQWQRAYEEINRFEKLLTDGGRDFIVKFWLQIDSGYAACSGSRPAGPTPKSSGSSPTRIGATAPEMARSTSRPSTKCSSAPTPHPSPWTVVEANDKEYARIKVLKTVVETIEKHLDKGRRGRGLSYSFAVICPVNFISAGIFVSDIHQRNTQNINHRQLPQHPPSP